MKLAPKFYLPRYKYGMFTCANCGETFVKSRSDEEAKKESDATFPDVPEDQMAVICDSCWKLLMGEG